MAQDQPSFSNCFTAQTSPNVLGNPPMNPDVGSIAVGISNIIINVCMSILLQWSKPSHLQASGTLAVEVGVVVPDQSLDSIEPEDSTLSTTLITDTKLSKQQSFLQSSVYGDELLCSVYGLFYQVYPILLATAACIGRQHLSLFEAHFAIAVSASPISVYLACMAFRVAFHTPVVLFHISKDTRTCLAVWLGLILPVFWLTLNLIISFHTKAFTNSYLCEGMNLLHWFEFQIVSNFIGVLDVMGRRDLWNDLHGRGGLGAVSVAALWVWGVYFVHHRSAIAEAFKAARKRYDDQSLWRRWLLRSWAFVKAPWDVIIKNHTWLLLVIVCCLHWSWILGIMQGMSLDNYQLTYGQALSLFLVVPPIVATVKLLHARWCEICKYILNFPRSLLNEMVFIFTGINDTREQDRSRDLSIMCAHGLLSLMLSGSFAIYIWKYVIAGSIPNPRTAVNNPHQNWKPFSIGVYVSGFLIGCLNVWFWSSYRARAVVWLYSKSNKYWTRIFLWIIHFLVIFPVALFMCVAPLFSPFAALPLAQEQQWAHRCHNFAGEAILEGRSYISKPPRASLSYPHLTSGGGNEYQYILNSHSNDIWTLVLENSSFIESMEGPEGFYPSIRSITYDLNENTMSAMCMDMDSLIPFPCMWGYFDRDAYFSIFLNDTRTFNEIKLRAVDREWFYSDDAPNFTLNILGPDGQPHDMIMQSAVTKRNHCDLLKVCLSGPPGLDILAPLGLVLWAEDRYTTYCTTPRLYG